jgi:hypothetical protein
MMTWDETNKRIADEFAWFCAHRAAIIKGHHGEEAVIRHHQVLKYFPDFAAACDWVDAQGYEPGDYAVQKCVTEDEEMDMYTPSWALLGGMSA